MPFTLLEKNRQWAALKHQQDPEFFTRLALQQKPRFLWIGCSDSRVPANEITGLQPGEVFVHRNISNRVENWDRNILAVLQFAITELSIEHIIVCGHHGCGGVKAAIDRKEEGPLGDWILPIRRMAEDAPLQQKDFSSEEDYINYLCEQNVREQLRVLRKNYCIQQAEQEGRKVNLHGWVYSLKDGLLKDLQGQPKARTRLGTRHRPLIQPGT